MKFLAAFFAILVVVAAQKPTLFSVVTEFTSKNYATASHLVSINPKTGSVTDLMETFYYAGSSATYDGISAYDFMNGVYYYATDGNSAFVFRGDVMNQKLMSPIAFPFEYIYELTYDVSQQRIIVAGAAEKQGDFLVSFPTDESKPWSVIANIDTDFDFDAGTVDSKNQMYYWTTLQKVNNTFSNVFIHSLSLSNPKSVSTVQVQCTYPMLWPSSLRFDSKHGKLYVLATQWIVKGKDVDLVYYIETLDPVTGACSSIKTEIPNGIAADFALDPLTQQLYVALAANANYIYTVDMTTGKTINSAVVANKLMPESLEFVYV